MSEKSENTQVRRAQDDIFRVLVLSEQQSKAQRYFIYYDIKKRKAAANTHICEAAARRCLAFLLDELN